MKELLAILLGAMLIDNMVLAKFMGICPFLGVSKKIDSALGMGVAVTAVMTASTMVTWPFYMLVLKPMNLTYLNNVSFILIIALFVQIIEIILKKVAPPLYNALGVYLPLITTNCAVLGVCMLNIDNSFTLIQSIINALGGGLGFTIALLLFSGVRVKMERSNVPAAFKGIPITLVAASIVALSFMGFSGLIEGMFGA